MTLAYLTPFMTCLLMVSSIFAQGNDTEAPTKPAMLAISNITQTSMDLEWSPSTDNIGVVSYNIYDFNEGFLMSTNGQTLSTTITGLSPFSSYNFSVSALDAAGNESEQRFGGGWSRTLPNCGITNDWVGNSALWTDDPLNWSDSAIPYECHDVIIDNGATVTAANVPSSNSSFNGEYLISTFEVGVNSEFSVDLGAEFHAIPSKPGPYTLSGNYSDQNPDCDDPLFCACCRGLFILDNVNCFYDIQDVSIIGTYSISGNILTVSLDPSLDINFQPIYRIIDNNNIVELGTADVLTK